MSQNLTSESYIELLIIDTTVTTITNNTNIVNNSGPLHEYKQTIHALNAHHQIDRRFIARVRYGERRKYLIKQPVAGNNASIILRNGGDGDDGSVQLILPQAL